MLAGLPFWEEGNDAILDTLNDSESDDDARNQQSKDSLKDIGYKNVLSQKVIEKIGDEKK